MINVQSIDHFVLTVASIPQAVAFYTEVLGMDVITFGEARTALQFGAHKINLHEAGNEFQPHASRPVPGSADVCFIVESLAAARAHLEEKGVEILDGPVPRTGARGAITSLYLRDPDGNLIELSEYTDE